MHHRASFSEGPMHHFSFRWHEDKIDGQKTGHYQVMQMMHAVHHFMHHQ